MTESAGADDTHVAALPARIGGTAPELRFLELGGRKVIDAVQVVGKAWAFVPIGKAPEDATLHPRLKGDYGVLHDIRVRFDNPEGAAARLEIALRSGGGAARAVVEVDGSLVETGNLDLGMEHVLITEKIAAGTKTRTVRVRMIPQSGSNYPMQLTMRSSVLK
jgi:hypothetical protein